MTGPGNGVERGAGQIPGIGGYGGRALAALIGPVGAWSWSLHHLSADHAAEAARRLRSLGFPMTWIPEVLGSKEIMAHAGLLLATAPGMVVASGIANIYARDPMAMANGARTLGEAYSGRFVLGLGVSSERTVVLRGGTYGRPVATMRGYLDAMAAAPYAGPEPSSPVPLVLAAIGPRMLELAAERADGAHPFFAPVAHTAFARRVLGPAPCLAIAQPMILTTDADRARRIARSFAAHYLTMPHHRANLGRFGFGEADLAGQGSDRLIDALVAWGDVDALVRRVREHHEAGADQVALMIRSEAADDPGLDAYRELAVALLGTAPEA
jgi:probable F420-dependent oxidoreductase